MRELHAIGVSADGRHVLLAGQEGASRPTHALVLDERLNRVLRGQSAEGEEAAVLSPKEIQAAIRAGASVDELAAATGVATTRIAHYAGPVLGERDRELSTLLRATQVSRRGRSALPLGEVVEAAVAAMAFVRPETVSWTAFRRDDGSWAARLSLVTRGRLKVAEWVREAGGHLSPLDTWATVLGHAGAPRRSSAVPVADRPVKAVKKVPAKRAAPAKKAVAAKKKPAPRKAVVAKKAPVKKAVVAKKASPVKKTVTAKKVVAAKRAAPTKKALPRKATPVKKAAPRKAPAKATARGRR